VSSPVVHHVAVLACCAVVWLPLSRARWTWRAPRVGVALWQLLSLAAVASVVGLPLQVALAPYGEPVPLALTRITGDLVAGRAVAVLGPGHLTLVIATLTGVALLGGAVVVGHCRAMRVRRRHLDALALVARPDAAAGGAMVLDHPGAAVYCVPGTSVVVVSAGVLRAFTPAELAAVMAHERAHLRARHDVVLLPFVVAGRLLGRPRWLRAAYESVTLLVEMCADDAAARAQGRAAVRRALLRLVDVAVATPPGTLGAAAGVTARAQRLAGPVDALPAPVRFLLVSAGILIATTPLSQLFWPS
jgi:hypothetical protein